MDHKGRLLAVDYGEKNIGLACSDALGFTVQPLPSIPNSGRRNLIQKIQSLVSEMDVCGLILGIPLNMDGSRNDSVVRMERLMHSLNHALKLPLTGVDERLSTVEAEEYWRRMNARQRKKYRTIDSLAAALMGLALWYLCGLIDWTLAAFVKRLLALGAIVIAGGSVYMLSSLLVRSPEALYLMNKLFARK